MIHDWGGKLGVRDVAVIVVYAERVGRRMREYTGGCQQVSCEIDGFMRFGPAKTLQKIVKSKCGVLCFVQKCRKREERGGQDNSTTGLYRRK